MLHFSGLPINEEQCIKHVWKTLCLKKNKKSSEDLVTSRVLQNL